MQLQGFANLAANPHHRVKAGARLLEDQANRTAAYFAQGLLRGADELLTLQSNAAVRAHLRTARQQT
jgi:hypothetical protein